MYRCKFYKGDYRERQEQANADRCAAYVEHHFNSSASPTASYAVAITGANASQTSRNWGRWYAQAVAREFSLSVGGDQGILVGGFDGRGDFNLRFTDMPAILLEPLFASNPRQAEWIRSGDGQTRLARILYDSIRRFFQTGGLIGFSVGHKYKRSAPNDRGAAVVGGGGFNIPTSSAEYIQLPCSIQTGPIKVRLLSIRGPIAGIGTGRIQERPQAGLSAHQYGTRLTDSHFCQFYIQIRLHCPLDQRGQRRCAAGAPATVMQGHDVSLELIPVTEPHRPGARPPDRLLAAPGAATAYEPDKIAAFLKRHQVAPIDAAPLLAAALAEAKRDGKYVFLWFSAPW